MFEKALAGTKAYWMWIFFLLIFIGIGFVCYLYQLNEGMQITGLGRDVSWGLYIGQFTFLGGVAASVVILIMLYYLHNVQVFSRMIVLGVFLAIAAAIMCILFIFVDLGNPARVLNVLLYPSPNSILFWDMIALNGYLLLTILIGWNLLAAERKAVAPPGWIKVLIYISIPWSISIRVVTAFLYAGLPARDYWLTAIMAARFLAAAFSAGPALLIILALLVKRLSAFDSGQEAINKLKIIVTYALLTSIFFFLLELFTAFYSNIPDHQYAFQYLFFGLEGYGKYVSWTWISVMAGVLSAILLLLPLTRKNNAWLVAACIGVFGSLWIEKGLTLVVAGFVPTPLGHISEYAPTLPEVFITLGIWATGILVLTLLYKIAIAIKLDPNSAWVH